MESGVSSDGICKVLSFFSEVTDMRQGVVRMDSIPVACML